MNNPSIYLMILGMAIVTYLPRLLPLVFLHKLELPPFIRKFLKCIPYTILGGLILPGALTSTGSFASAFSGCLAAVVLSWSGFNLLVTVLGSVLITAFVLLI